MKRKVYVIDYELISPLGIGNKQVFESIKKNISAVSEIENFYTGGLGLNIGT